MSLEYVSTIDPSLTLEKMRTCPETQYFDRKSARLKRVDLARALSAFANASGGTIVIGIEDDGFVSGVSPEEENGFRKAASEYLTFLPRINIEVIGCVDDNNHPCNIMLFFVAPCADNIIALRNGEVYLRIGDSSKKLSPEEYTALEYSRGTRSYESTIVSDATVTDLDESLISQYASLLDVETSSPWDILKARGLIKEKDGVFQVTTAAILLFGKIPTQFLPCARLRFLKYNGIVAGVGSNLNIVKDVTIEKPLPELLTEAQSLLSSQMREFQHLDRSGKFSRVSEYPDFAWLEGLVNAITHRDYSIRGEYIRISMFDDRIEFSSPGKLPSIVTVDNIRDTRFSRNPMIARVLSDFGWVRELNEGVKRIYVDMGNYFLDPPEFSEPNGNTVLLVLKNNIAIRSVRTMESSMSTLASIWNTLPELDREIIYYVANVDHCTPRDLVQMISKSRPTIASHIRKLIELGVIKEHSSSPQDPTKYYTL